MRRTYRYIDGEMVLVAVNGRPLAAQPEHHHYVQPDTPGYESPITGLWVEGRRARRDDLARHGCRPWEGLQVEKREAAKVQAEHERKLDHLAEKMAHIAWAQAPERLRKQFRSK